MHSKIRTMIGTGALVLAVGALGLPAAHAAYPDRATRIVVPTTPGGRWSTRSAMRPNAS